ncbi:4a-hydroxytetrahydrobiopterin dehydratase [Anaeromyxobacter paludicola]|uniref:4a-hydroxytetrahydrobiopterin dehydratase n=1 Tax=Anaeromyxobacter paludicola TaxID=2918171 RepID=A0ABM7XBW2_9BACT|nr:4a-hydroxytetrahydrobiopterin dehydratase [Anaeromyxobacter paludicola]BDG09347.1 4a-hydroxytetrahydrobiopterin dehydratase [Anaeromyxobacter paludicola]
MDWRTKKCVPCEGGVPAIPAERAAALLGTLDGWSLRDGKLWKQLRFRDFREAIRFVDAAAEVAEAEGHHPDLSLHDYRLLDVTLSTHAIGGLSENDFILAAKLDALPR